MKFLVLIAAGAIIGLVAAHFRILDSWPAVAVLGIIVFVFIGLGCYWLGESIKEDRKRP